MGLAAAKKKKNKNNYDDQYYETEDHHYETEEYYPPKYYAKRQGRNAELDPKVSHDSDDEINSLPTEIPDGSDNSLAPEIAGSMTDEGSIFGRQTGCNCLSVYATVACLNVVQLVTHSNRFVADRFVL